MSRTKQHFLKTPEYGCKSLSSGFPYDFQSGFYAVLRMIHVNLNYKTERQKLLHLGKMLCKLYFNYSAYLQNIFCFEAYLLNLYSIDSQCAQYALKRGMIVFM